MVDIMILTRPFDVLCLHRSTSYSELITNAGYQGSRRIYGEEASWPELHANLLSLCSHFETEAAR